MARFNLRFSSWLHANPNSKGNPDRKKKNRRALSGFGSVSPRRNGDGVIADGALGRDGHTKEAINGNAETPSAAWTAGGARSSVKPQKSASQMVTLARKINVETERLETYLKDNNLPMPGFDVNAPGDFPKLPDDIQKSRLEIMRATKELRDLVTGPREGVRWGVWDFLDVLALQIVNNYGIAKLVPLEGTVTLAHLQTLTPLDPVNLARVLRVAMTNHVFCEPSPGVIAHTAASRLLASDAELAAWVGFNAEDIFPAAAHVLPALKTHPEATSLARTGFQFSFDTVDVEPMFVTFGKDAERARRMGRAMASLTGGEGYEVRYLVDVEGGGYDFSEVDSRGGTFVDIGGSHGFVCVDLARRYRNMRFVVQDLPKTVASAPLPICEDEQVAGRIEFVAHDFFTPQAVKGADVYFFRWIMHNYSTPYAVKILQNLIPALKPGARVIINDHCLLEPGQESHWDEKIMRRMDMVMLSLLNAQERTEPEFRELFGKASDGFVFKGVTRPNGCRMSIIEAVWEPGSVESKDDVAVSEAEEPGQAGQFTSI